MQKSMIFSTDTFLPNVIAVAFIHKYSDAKVDSFLPHNFWRANIHTITYCYALKCF